MIPITRRDFLKQIILTTGLLNIPQIAQANYLQPTLNFIQRQIDKKEIKKSKIEIPFADHPHYRLSYKDPTDKQSAFETISIETGSAEIHKQTTSTTTPFRKVNEINVASRLSKAHTSNDDIKVFKLEFLLEGYNDTEIRKNPSYPTQIKRQRNINGSQSYLWLAHPLYAPGTEKFIRIIPREQEFWVIEKNKDTFISGWEKGTPYKEDKKAQLAYHIGEKTLDGMLELIFPNDKKRVKEKLEDLVEWWKGEMDYLYQEDARNIDESFIAQQIEIYSPRLMGYTQEAMKIEFGVWNPGKDVNINLIGNLYLGNPSEEGGFVKNWKLEKGIPIFS